MLRFQSILIPLRAALLCSMLLAPLALAQSEPPIAVHFPQGANSTTVSGTITGDASIEYTVEVATAQSIQIKVTGSNNAYFNLYAPGQDTALNAGGDGQRFSGLLTTPGTYRIQLYLPRAMARRNEVARFTLSIALR
ncbi:MAG: PPC domain-containing protein [Pseudoxanthomonas sp.]